MKPWLRLVPEGHAEGLQGILEAQEGPEVLEAQLRGHRHQQQGAGALDRQRILETEAADGAEDLQALHLEMAFQS